MKKLIIDHKHILILVGVYLFFRLINLTLLPVFNDEGIYLDWGWREITIPGNLFYSLYDAKQPLLMWLFGISMHLFTDALFAGRMVSVLMGLVTLVGLYQIGKEYFSTKVGLVSSLLYIVIPFFSFFDRQALMESSVGAVGVWSLYFTLKILNNQSVTKYQIFLGIVLGFGILIKSNVLLFILGSLCVFLMAVKQKQITAVASVIIFSKVVATIIVTSILLLIQPQFWSTLSMNNRYSLTISELLRFPINHFFSNLLINMEIIFVLFTPIIFLSNLFGVVVLLKKKDKVTYLIGLWVVVLLLLQTILVKQSSQRYLVSFLPILTICSAYFGVLLAERFKKLAIVFFGVLIFIPAMVTIIQIISPINYFKYVSLVTKYSDIGGYVSSANSGNGIEEVRAYLEAKAKVRKIYVVTALNSGNPESALRAYFARNDNIDVVYFDGQMFDQKIYEYNCLQTDRPFYFVSRDEQQAGLNKFFTLVRKVQNPYGENRLGIYSLNTNCKDKALPIDMRTLIQYEH